MPTYKLIMRNLSVSVADLLVSSCKHKAQSFWEGGCASNQNQESNSPISKNGCSWAGGSWHQESVGHRGAPLPPGSEGSCWRGPLSLGHASMAAPSSCQKSGCAAWEPLPGGLAICALIFKADLKLNSQELTVSLVPSLSQILETPPHTSSVTG